MGVLHCCSETAKWLGQVVAFMILFVFRMAFIQEEFAAFLSNVPILIAAAAIILLVIAGLPLLTAAIMILLAIYFALRFIEVVSGNDGSSEASITIGDCIAYIIVKVSQINLLVSWEFWLIVLHTVPGLKHRMFLELEAIKWFQLCLVVIAFCILFTIPRLFVMVVVQKELHFINGVVGVLECIFFIAAEAAIIKFAPRWKHHVTLGFETWKFIQVLVLILLVIMVIDVASHLIVFAVQYLFGDWKHVVYFTKGLRTSVNFMVISNSLILVWITYFQPRFERAAVASNRVLEYITWAFVCLMIASMLWLVKKCIVLMWTSHAVYNRLHNKIIVAGKQFYVLRLLRKPSPPESQKEIKSSGSSISWSTLSGRQSKSTSAAPGSVNVNQPDKHDSSGMPKEKGLVEEKITTLPTHKLQTVIKRFEDLKLEDPGTIENLKLKDRDETIANKFANYLSQHARNIKQAGDLQAAIQDKCGWELENEVVEVLYNQIKQVDEKEGVDAENFEKWVAKAYRNCWQLNNTIIGAKEVANYLNKLLTGLFLPVVVLIWLLVTKILTIKLLLLLTSPILAATFIFGDTCKSIFQGIIFAFVMHIFDVGDVCVIDGTQMEVKRIGIWRTTFVKVVTREEVTYQNSILADKLIIKHTGGLDLNDSVEYCVPIRIWSPKTFDRLKEKIDRYLEENSTKYRKHALGVLVQEVGEENVKIAIHFKHRTSDQDMFYSDCLKKQSKSRADLLMKAKQIMQSMKTEQD